MIRETTAAYLERLKPVKPEWEASSMSGVTMRSIMSVSTVKVGTTMKSMNPGDEDVSKGNVSMSAVYSHSLFCAIKG